MAKEREREKIFTKFDKLWGYEQYVINRFELILSHSLAAYAVYLQLTRQIPYSTIVLAVIIYAVHGFGITVGCHRYWTHKSFKAKLPLQWLLMVFQSMGPQWPILKWCLDHRVHHKYTDTDADPHNSKRGFWFSHIGWLILPKHEELEVKLKSFDMSDLEQDPVIRFQSKWYFELVVLFHLILPISIFYYVYHIPLLSCAAVNAHGYVLGLHFTFSVNSFAHFWGDKPYDKTYTSTDNPIVSLLALGEGWHNYHHAFPWDYKTSEFGWKLNPSTVFIDFFAWLGLVSEMKTVPKKILADRIKRTGDGSHFREIQEPVWGWGDKEIPDDFRKMTKVLRSEGSP